MLPLVSTMPLHNLHFLLSESIYRQQHVCSNLVTLKDLQGISGGLKAHLSVNSETEKKEKVKHFHLFLLCKNVLHRKGVTVELHVVTTVLYS